MLDEYEHAVANRNVSVSMRFFVNHIYAEISRVASDLLGTEYTLSKIHQRFSNVKPEREMLIDLVPKVVFEFKLQNVKKQIAECRLDLQKLEKEGGDQQKMEQLVSHLMVLNQVKAVISKVVGFRTIM